MCHKSSYFDNYCRILADARAIAGKSGFDADKVNVLVVTKYARAEQIAQLLSCGGISMIGESRLQDSLEKWNSPLLSGYKVQKFFIGHLQTNKAAKVVDNFDFICSLDSLRLARCIDKEGEKLGRSVSCLVQIKLTDRETQGGLPLEEAGDFIEQVRKGFKHITLRGIMAIAPDTEDKALLKECFKKAAEIFKVYFTKEDFLSLGMSGDYETAVAEGSNLPRIGSAVFK